MREIGIVAFILTLVLVNTELRIATPNCNTEIKTPTLNWNEAKDKVVKIGAYDDG